MLVLACAPAAAGEAADGGTALTNLPYKTGEALDAYEKDMAARAEENAYLVALLKGAGNTRVTGMQVADRDHGSVANRIADAGDPARAAILAFVRANGGVAR